jgi:hypothetical protein
MIRIGILVNNESPATDFYRTVGVFTRLAQSHPNYEIKTITPQSQWHEYFLCDVMIFSRPNGDSMLGLIRDYKRMRRDGKVIFDHDDLLNNVPTTNPAAAHFNRDDVKKSAVECFQYADHVIVTTPVLKEAFKDWHKNITVIPNGIDLKATPFTDKIQTNPAARIKTAPKQKDNQVNPDALLKILWRGSMTHMEDLKTVDSFWKWATLTETTNVGWIGILKAYVDTHYPGVLSRDWRPFVFHYFEELRNTGADYGVFPLVNHPFNHAKSNIFAMEMLVAGIVPYAPMGFDEFAHPGVRHYSSSGDLIKQFMGLLKDDQDYHLTIEEGRTWITENRDVEKLNLKRIEILENL